MTEPEDVWGPPQPHLFGMKERVYSPVPTYMLGPTSTGRGFAARPMRTYNHEPCTFRPTLHLYMGVGQR